MSQLNRSTYSAPVLPEKVLQFGTGMLLRGLPDYFIHNANQQGLFEGSIVIVKSTGGPTDTFAEQDGLYTMAVRGVAQGETISDNTVITAVSRVLSAQTDWRAVLDLARKQDLQVIISNTTEVGLNYVEESIFQSPPQSFPAKLTAFLYERFKNFGGSRSRGLVVIPTELLPDNGLILRDAVEKLAQYNELGRLFTKWMKFHVRFCNSLVDRIVTAPTDAVRAELTEQTGFADALAIQTEPYRLWAIEGDDRVRDILSFAAADPQVIIDEDISFYRERKLRILNGTHTFSVPLAYLLGLETVYDANTHPLMAPFIESLMRDEVVPTVPADTYTGGDGPAALRQFADDVLDRFRNPATEHFLLNILMQETAKMKARNVATIERYYEQFNQVPARMALGFGAYLLFMKAVREENGTYVGEVSVNGGVLTYPIRDDKAAYFYEAWQPVSPADPDAVRALVQRVCADQTLWDSDLSALPGFVDAVFTALNALLTVGPEAVLQESTIAG